MFPAEVRAEFERSTVWVVAVTEIWCMECACGCRWLECEKINAVCFWFKLAQLCMCRECICNH